MAHLLDDIEKARRELDEQIVNIDLRPGEVICETCHLTYWRALGHCPTCADN